MHADPSYDRPVKVLLVGDLINNEDYRGTLPTVLDHQMDNMSEVISTGSRADAAKGAAKLAKR